jgi:hypothetical protein
MRKGLLLDICMLTALFTSIAVIGCTKSASAPTVPTHSAPAQPVVPASPVLPPTTKPTPAPKPTPAAPVTTPVNTTGLCQIRWENGEPLPDPNCTPGAVQSTDTAAICTPGWASAHREYFTKQERELAFAKYGIQTDDPAGYGEYDHLVPLELGGANTPDNLWPEPGKIPNAKDTIENIVHNQVCSGKVPLRLAQQEFEDDWTKIPDTFQASLRIGCDRASVRRQVP